MSDSLARYCEEGDDSIVAFLFRDYPSGWYIEVGCNHPIHENVTLILSQMGWKGISLDPQLGLIEKWSELRPSDSFYCEAVSGRGEIVNYTMYENSYLNSINDEAKLKASEDNQKIIENITITSLTINEVFQLVPDGNKVNFLSINCRGADLEIISSLNFEANSPDVIRIEMLYFNFDRPQSHPVYRLLRDKGYALIVKTFSPVARNSLVPAGRTGTSRTSSSGSN